MRYLIDFIKEFVITLFVGMLFLAVLVHFRPVSDDIGLRLSGLLLEASILYAIFQTFGLWLYNNHPKSKLRIFFWTSRDI